MSVWNESQVSAFLIGCDNPLFYRMAFFTGMRRAELVGLKWEDLSWDSGELRIRRQVYEQRAAVSLSRTQDDQRAKGGKVGAGLAGGAAYPLYPDLTPGASNRW